MDISTYFIIIGIGIILIGLGLYIYLTIKPKYKGKSKNKWKLEINYYRILITIGIIILGILVFSFTSHFINNNISQTSTILTSSNSTALSDAGDPHIWGFVSFVLTLVVFFMIANIIFKSIRRLYDFSY